MSTFSDLSKEYRFDPRLYERGLWSDRLLAAIHSINRYGSLPEKVQLIVFLERYKYSGILKQLTACEQLEFHELTEQRLCFAAGDIADVMFDIVCFLDEPADCLIRSICLGLTAYLIHNIARHRIMCPIKESDESRLMNIQRMLVDLHIEANSTILH